MMTIAEEVAAFEQDEVFVRGLLDQITFPVDERGSLASGLFVQAGQHGSAVMFLFLSPVPSRGFGSAWALTRAMIECLIRAQWAKDCASKNDVSRLMRQARNVEWTPTSREMAKRLDVTPVSQFAVQLAESTWSSLFALTHGDGPNFVANYVRSRGVDFARSDDDVAELAHFTRKVLFIDYYSILVLCNRPDLADRCAQRLMDMVAAEKTSGG